MTAAPACLLLALAALVAPAPLGPARLVRLAGRRSGPVAAPRPAALAAAVGALVGFAALGPAGALAGGVAGSLWHRRRARRRAGRTAAAAVAELADALGRIVEELRAGAHPAGALGGVRGDGPLAGAALGPAARAAAFGDGVPAALTAEAERRPELARPLSRVAQAWSLAERHGVPLADLLAGVHADLRWRIAHSGRVGAQLAGPRATAAVLAGLPALGLALGQLIGAAPLAVLRSSAPGQLLVVVGVGLTAAGAAWTSRILRAAVAP